MREQNEPEKSYQRYTAEDIVRAKRAMLSELANISNGILVPGCCTQDCCDEGAQAIFTGVLQPKLYTKQDLIQAQRSMLRELAELSGGTLVAGCCTQGCCDPDAIAWLQWVVNPPPLRSEG